VKCSEFHRLLLEDPAREEAEFLAHRAACDACAAEAREVERMDGAIRDLLSEQAPAERSIPRRSRPDRRWSPMALAASLAGLVAVFTAVWQPWQSGAADGLLADEVMDHVLHEPRALVAHEALTPAGWRAASAAVRLDPEGFRHAVVTYAMACELAGRPGLHLVMRSDSGPITLLVIVDTQVAEPRLVSREGFRGVVRPVRHGSIAVIGSPDAPVEALARDLEPFVRIRS